MSQPCADATCKKTSRALCYCCQQGLCLLHLKEHNDLLISQLNPLVDQINTIDDRLKAVNIENTNGDYRQTLDQWRMDSHKKIDDFFDQKLEEINRRISEKVKKRREEINDIQSKIAGLIREEEVSRQDIDLLASTIRNLDQDVNKLEDTFLKIKTRPVVLADSLIHIEESNINRFDLPKLPPVYKTIGCIERSCVVLANNQRFLLIHQAPTLCLIDRKLILVRQVTYKHKDLRNMCWSSSLDRFVIINENGVFTVDQKSMSTNKLRTIQENTWSCCTCSDTSLFLSTYEYASCLVEYRLLPTIQFVREWKPPDTCQRKECIADMKYSNGSVALVIQNPSDKKLFLDLRNIKTLDRLWSFNINYMNLEKKAFRCCILDGEEWLVVDNESDRLIHITKDGKMKSSCAYKPKPWCVGIFGPDIMAIVTDNGVNFHKLQ